MQLKFGLNIKPGKSFHLGSKKVLNPLDEDVFEPIPKAVEKEETTFNELHQQAILEDENVFDYDAVYDDLKKQEFIRKKLKDGVDADGNKRARYMEDLINTSKKRKLMLEKQREKKVQKERELELEMFGEKEEFVTEAYKQQKEELKRLEEEEKRREAMESNLNRERDVSQFYRGLLNQMERTSGPLILGDKNMALEVAEVQAEVNTTEVARNDNDEVVDKRDLLKGGLNISSKALKKKQMEKEKKSEEEIRRNQVMDYEKRRMLQMQRERNRMIVEQQKLKAEHEKRMEKQKEKEKVVEQLTSSGSNVSDAKARYLARKAAQQQK